MAGPSGGSRWTAKTRADRTESGFAEEGGRYLGCWVEAGGRTSRSWLGAEAGYGLPTEEQRLVLVDLLAGTPRMLSAKAQAAVAELALVVGSAEPEAVEELAAQLGRSQAAVRSCASLFASPAKLA